MKWLARTRAAMTSGEAELEGVFSPPMECSSPQTLRTLATMSFFSAKFVSRKAAFVGGLRWKLRGFWVWDLGEHLRELEATIGAAQLGLGAKSSTVPSLWDTASYSLPGCVIAGQCLRPPKAQMKKTSKGVVVGVECFIGEALVTKRRC